MARYCERDLSHVLEAARIWAQRCLVEDGSIFGDGALWTTENLGLLDRYFVQQPDSGSGDFFEKLSGQMSGAPPAAPQLMAEVLWALFLFPSSIGAEKKREGIGRTWGFSGSALELGLPMLSDEVLAGVGSAGTAFNTLRWQELNYAIPLFTAVKRLAPAERAELVSDYERLSVWLESMPPNGDRQFRHMLRFLLCPDRVERMSSNGDRRRVLDAFGIASQREMKNWSDRQFDNALFNLRQKLTDQYGTEILDFYRPPLVDRWKSADVPQTPKDLSAFDIGYAEMRERFLLHMPGLRTFASHQRFAEHERGYKDELIDLFTQDVAPMMAASDWLGAGTAAIGLLVRPLKKAANKPQNIVGWRYVDVVRKLEPKGRALFGRAVADLIDESVPIAERIDAFVDGLESLAGDGQSVAVAAQRSMAGFYLTLAHPQHYLFMKSQELQQALRKLDPSFQWSTAALQGADVRRVQSLAQRVFERLDGEGWKPRDLIDVQGFLWVAVGYGPGDRVAEVGPEEAEYVSDIAADLPAASVRPLNQILFGPPGTGKTFTLQERLRTDYTEAASAVDPETWRAERIAEQIGGLTWWEAAGAALYDLGRPATVPELAKHPFIDAVASAKRRIRGVNATLWGTLQHHTVIESTTVNIALRMAPAIFDKSADSRWQLVGPWQEHLAEAVAAVEAIRQGPKPADAPVKRYEFVTFHQSFSYEDFMEGLTPVVDEDTGGIRYQVRKGVFLRLCERARLDPQHPYAMVIDEINRGNVSKVFGELIALIEIDKRAGCENALTVTLPYSGEAFSVPANVHLIGSMNTADRSLAGLDIALRRRFEFLEVAPKPELLRGRRAAGVDLSELLEVINKRIAMLLDNDHRLGHAYFMRLPDNAGLDDLEALFRKQILPLLQEYFFEDWQRIAWVLNDHRKDKDFRFVVKLENEAQRLFGSEADVPVDAKLWRLDEKAFGRIESYRGIVGAGGA